MSNKEVPKVTLAPPVQARVATIFDDGFKIALNKGRKHGIEVGAQYLVYAPGPEVVDPETDEVLGQIELVKGRGKVVEVEENFCVIVSVETQASLPMRPYAGGMLGQIARLQNDLVPAPFKKAQPGDLAKRI